MQQRVEQAVEWPVSMTQEVVHVPKVNSQVHDRRHLVEEIVGVVVEQIVEEIVEVPKVQVVEEIVERQPKVATSDDIASLLAVMEAMQANITNQIESQTQSQTEEQTKSNRKPNHKPNRIRPESESNH